MKTTTHTDRWYLRMKKNKIKVDDNNSNSNNNNNNNNIKSLISFLFSIINQTTAQFIEKIDLCEVTHAASNNKYRNIFQFRFQLACILCSRLMIQIAPTRSVPVVMSPLTLMISAGYEKTILFNFEFGRMLIRSVFNYSLRLIEIGVCLGELLSRKHRFLEMFRLLRLKIRWTVRECIFFYVRLHVVGTGRGGCLQHGEQWCKWFFVSVAANATTVSIDDFSEHYEVSQILWMPFYALHCRCDFYAKIIFPLQIGSVEIDKLSSLETVRISFEADYKGRTTHKHTNRVKTREARKRKCDAKRKEINKQPISYIVGLVYWVLGRFNAMAAK